jgi:hypothetical protein
MVSASAGAMDLPPTRRDIGVALASSSSPLRCGDLRFSRGIDDGLLLRLDLYDPASTTNHASYVVPNFFLRIWTRASPRASRASAKGDCIF